MKVCKKCNEEKENNQFYWNRRICKDCYCVDTDKYRKEHPEQGVEYTKKWRNNNPEKAKESDKAAHHKAWRNNKEVLSERNKKYFLLNIEKIQEYVKKWKKNNTEKTRVYEQNRRAKKSNNGGSYTVAEWLDLCNRYGNKCLRCGQNKKLSPDHIVPISKGGTSYIDNIQPLCQECNSWKKAKTIDYRT